MEAPIDMAAPRHNGCNVVDFPSEELLDQFYILVQKKPCDILSDGVLMSRIGSPSLRATIWKYMFPIYRPDDSCDGIVMALKLQYNYDVSFDEFNIGRFLSSQYPEYFLITYDMLDCVDVKVGDHVESGQFIIMEMAVSDLRQMFANTFISPPLLDKYINNVIEGVRQLGLSHIYHGDLHIANVFIVLRQGPDGREEKVAVIGDFGESKSRDSPTTVLSDLYTFFSTLLPVVSSKPRMYRGLTSRIKAMIKYISQLSGQVDTAFNMWMYPIDPVDPVDPVDPRTDISDGGWEEVGEGEGEGEGGGEGDDWYSSEEYYTRSPEEMAEYISESVNTSINSILEKWNQ